MKNTIYNTIQNNLNHILLISLLLAISSVSFYKIGFLKQVPAASDTIQWRTAANSMIEFNEKNIEQAQWNSNVFSGMPGYMISFGSKWPFINNLRKFTNNVIDWRVLYLFIGALGIYLVMIYLGFTPLVAFVGAIAFSLSTHFMGLIEIGHNPKFRATILIPWIFLGISVLKKERNLFGLGILALFITSQLRENHPQISYYTFLMVGLYWLHSLYITIKTAEWKKFNMFTLLLFIAFALSFLSIAQPYFSTYEYGQYTIRGGETGLTSEYATSWSFNPAEIISFIVPSFFGGTNTHYWGWMRFTQTSMYMGVIIFLFAIFGISNGKDKTKLFLILASIFSLLFAFGKYFPLLSNFLLQYFPFYNKFRVPAMTLVILEFTIIILAGFGIQFLLNNLKKDKVKKYLLNSIKIFGASAIIFILIFSALNSSKITKEDILSKEISSKQILLFLLVIDIILPFIFLILSPIFSRLKKHIKIKKAILIILTIIIVFMLFSSVLHHKPLIHNYDLKRYQTLQQFTQITSMRLDLIARDAATSYILILSTLLLLFLYSKGTINVKLLLILIAVLSTGDLLNQRYHFLKELTPKQEIANKEYLKTKVDNWLENDSDQFRIYPIGSEFSKNKWASYNQTIGGYHGAKLKRYQEIIENCLNKELISGLPINWNIVNMLNTKYVLYHKSLHLPNLRYKEFFPKEKIAIHENIEYLPRAWFVENIETISKPKEIFKRLNQRSFDPSDTAILEKEIDAIELPDSSSVQLSNFNLHNLSFEIETDKKSFLTVSEIYYPAGWKAYIDGKETEIFATNYILRGVIIPEGKHTLEFKFVSPIYNISVTLSLIGLILISLITITGLIITIRKNYSGKIEYVLKVDSNEI